MKIFKMILAANEVRGVDLSGQYFELRKALYAVDVQLLTKDGGIVSLLEGATESDYTREGVFQTVIITNGATPQTIEFWYGFGDAGSRRFSGNVSGSVDLNAATLAALESVDLNAATIASLKLLSVPSAYFNNTGALTLGASLTAVLPAENTTGLIVTSAYMHDFSGAQYGAQFWLHNTAAPAGVLHPTAGVILAMGNNSGGPTNFANLPSPVFIPAGRGLYFLSAIASNSAAAYRGISWRAA